MPDEINTAPSPTKSSMMVSAQGLVVAENHADVWRICCAWFKSRLCPASFKSAEQVFFAHQTLASLGVNPLLYMRFTGFVRSSFILYGDLPLTLVHMSGKLLGKPTEFWIDGEYNKICRENKNLHVDVYAAVCQMTPADCNGDMQERVFTIDDAKQAGKLPAKPGDVWHAYCKRMLQMKARGWLIKDLFPEVLNGMPQAEYDLDVMPDAKDSGVVERTAPTLDLNAQYSEEVS